MITARDAREETAVGADHIHSIAAPAIPELKLKALNPAADEFTASRSTSQATSEVSAGRRSEGDDDSMGSPAPSPHAEFGREPTFSRGNRPSGGPNGRSAPPGYGWESPQGVLPSNPPSLTGMSSQQAPPGESLPFDPSTSAFRGDGGASPPPGSHLMHHPGVMPHYAYPYPPVYPGHGGHPGLERSASPPAIYTPAGGSPPLGPGFISIPVAGSPPNHSPLVYHPHPHGASPPHSSMGSSPPGGAHGHPYMYMHSHHSGEYHPQMGPPGYSTGPGASAVEYAAQRLSGMSLNREGSGPVRSEGRASARIARSHRAGGTYNPAEFEFNLAEAENSARTTVMVRNIPNKYTQGTMLRLLDEAGFGGTFDFFYLPIDFRNRCGLGYAFINMLTPALAAKLYKAFHNKRWDECVSRKVAEITYARVQGRDALVQHFRSSKFPSEDAEYQPLVYSVDEKEDTDDVAVDPKPIHAFLGTSATGKSGGSSGSSGVEGDSPRTAAASAAGDVGSEKGTETQ